MKIHVCVKHVPDSAATITIQGSDRIDERVTFLLNPYDENALEAALRIKGEVGPCEVVAVTLGKAGAANTLRSALAMGADRGIHIQTTDMHDSQITARALAAAMLQDGLGDLVFTGKTAIDSEGCQTMYRLGALLDWPAVSPAISLRLESGRAFVACELEAGGCRTLQVPLPCVIGTAKALNQPRYPTLPDIMKARKKEIRTLSLESLNLEKPAGGMALMGLRPAVESRRGKILEGPPEAAVTQLIELLRKEAKVI